MMEFLKTNNRTIYSGILVILSVCLLLGYVPGMSAFSSWVTPPVALFLGLAFALLCGQANKFCEAWAFQSCRWDFGELLQR